MPGSSAPKKPGIPPSSLSTRSKLGGRPIADCREFRTGSLSATVSDLLEACSKKIRGAAKLVLWLQLLRQGEYGLFLRFYAAVWLAAAAVIGASLWLLVGSGIRLPVAPKLVVLLCPFLVLLAYAVARFVPLLILALAVLIPGTMTIAPSVGRDDSGVFAPLNEDQRSVYVGTGDLKLFLKGSGTCLCLSSITFLLQALARLPSSRAHKRRWPLRWAALTVILASGAIGLEVLRLSLQLAPQVRVPWARPLWAVMVEPGWPQAITVWLWLNTAYLLARYDAKLIPYLLRRIGQPWAPDELSLGETYLVDELVRQLTARPGVPPRAKPNRAQSGRRRRPS